jgi:hypothetical protein
MTKVVLSKKMRKALAHLEDQNKGIQEAIEAIKEGDTDDGGRRTVDGDEPIPTPDDLAGTINHDTACEIADRICEIRAEMEGADREIDLLEADLKKYVVATGVQDLGALQAQQRTSSPKLVFEKMTPKQIEVVRECLEHDLGDYYIEVKRSLNAAKIFASYNHDANVRNALAVHKVALAQETNWVFKRV